MNISEHCNQGNVHASNMATCIGVLRFLYAFFMVFRVYQGNISHPETINNVLFINTQHN